MSVLGIFLKIHFFRNWEKKVHMRMARRQTRKSKETSVRQIKQAVLKGVSFVSPTNVRELSCKCITKVTLGTVSSLPVGTEDDCK